MNPLPILLGGIVAAIAAVASKKSTPTSANVELDASLPSATTAQVLGALANEKDPAKLLALAQQMTSQGNPLAAAALRARAAQLQGQPPPPVVIPPPGVISPPPASVPQLDASIDPSTAAAVLQALATETDPNKLAQFAASIQFTFPVAAALLMSKATSLGFNPNAPPAPGPAPAPPPAVFVPPPPPPPPAPAPVVVVQPPAPAPAPAPAPVPPAPAGTIVTFTPAELAQGTSLHPSMTADEWEQTMILLNDFLNANAADSRISFIDLSWFRDQADDLQDAGNLQLGMEALTSLSLQNSAAFAQPSAMGIYDAPTLGNLYAWAQKNPGANTANMTVLGPFFNGLLAAVRKAYGPGNVGLPTATSGMRMHPTVGWRSSSRVLPPKMAMRRIG